MPPRLHFFSRSSIAFRPRPLRGQESASQRIPHRTITADEKPLPTADGQQKGPNQDQLPHVSEEAAKISEITGEEGPEPEQQGTPVQEILQRDADGKDKAPKVIKEDLKKQSSTPKGSRSFSTNARRYAGVATADSYSAAGLPDAVKSGVGHKFGLPDLKSMPRTEHIKRRYDPVVDQVTKLIMRHGKLSAAQKNMDTILDILRTTPAPVPLTSRPLLPSPPPQANLPPSALPLHPIAYLTTAIDSVAPLLKIRQQKGVAGGGANLPIPAPLALKQRRRTAVNWILAAAERRNDSRLAHRVAQEIIAVAEGRSSVWERRNMVHKMAVSARANVKFSVMRKK